MEVPEFQARLIFEEDGDRLFEPVIILLITT
jgi:hypothetical protein